MIGGLVRRVARLGLLLLPVTLLVIASLRVPEADARLLWLGALFQALACLLALASRSDGGELAGPGVVMFYVIALSWLLLGAQGEDWFRHLAQAILLVVPLLYFAAQCLSDSGAPALRRARSLARRLASRTDLPPDLQTSRQLPEVKALREALHVDASPALELLNHPRNPVRVAALAALEFRQNWRPGQAQTVLGLAQHSRDPEVRAAAVGALANLDDRTLVEAVAEFLGDPDAVVRQTAAEALLWNGDNWAWIRLALRKALGGEAGQDDGPLPLRGAQLTEEAATDLTAWTTEKGVLAVRAALTLGAHYAQTLAARPDPELVGSLSRQLSDPAAPSLLRLELARLLYQQRALDPGLLRRLIGPATPGPIRLIAVDALLSEGPSPEALTALHELARVPNREMALSTADVLQRRLGVDFGLPRGPAPALHSRQAAEVARRVMLWASQAETNDDAVVGHEESGRRTPYNDD